VVIDNIQTRALIDTGSCVSTISDRFYKQHLSHLELQPVSHLLEIECADGNSLPYLGFISADMKVVGIPMDHTQHCLFLVVPESDYSKNIPVLLGTNILSEFMTVCKSVLGNKYLQTSGLFTSWYLAFCCLSMRERTLQKQKSRLAIVRSAEKNTILIRPKFSGLERLCN